VNAFSSLAEVLDREADLYENLLDLLANGSLGRARARLETTLLIIDVMNQRVTALLHQALRLFDTTLDVIRDAAGLNHQYTAAAAGLARCWF
jgi:hypothetical protein